MIAVDTNLLVYAHREDSPWHEKAYAKIRDLAEGRSPWVIFWACFHEFLAIVTHPRIYDPPTPFPLALDQVEAWLEAPTLMCLAEPDGYWAEFRPLLESGKIVGPCVHDARIATLCLAHGIRELWTADRDFGRFPQVRAFNPLIE